MYLVNIWLSKSHNSEEFQREITAFSGNCLSLTHLKGCMSHREKGVLTFPITVLVTSVHRYLEQERCPVSIC